MPYPVRWPGHWYYDQDRIRCIVPHCRFVSNTNRLDEQYEELSNHCMYTPGVEHALLILMLQQKFCAIDNCNHTSLVTRRSYRIRLLFDHEEHAHGTAAMSDICSFVTLAREDRLNWGYNSSHTMVPEPDCQRLAFERMMEKVEALPTADLDLLFYKAGYESHEYNPRNLGVILTLDHSAPSNHHHPSWRPVSADNFLWFCRPHPTHPADHDWRHLWRSLRAAYAAGRI